MQEPKLYLASGHVARRLGISTERVRQLAREGRLRPVVITPGGQRLFSVEEIDRHQREVASRTAPFSRGRP